MKLTSICSLVLFVATAAGQGAPETNRVSAFYPATVVTRVRENANGSEWGKKLRADAVAQAEPWTKMSDEQLWGLMFGATIPRSWHVYSNGNCPACGKPVPMYDWQIDALVRPWKVKCPQCGELFPKNDFKKFYDSGLDAHGVFDPTKGDRSLLFNVEHPDAKDPLHTFGVDDGTGFVRGAERWRFIPTYLIYGQWKQAVHLGIKRLATAYVMTGEPVFAHKAAILLDRVADLYPTFDFMSQGILYESAHGDGYVSVWHDATIETREMTLAYDAIKTGIDSDSELVKFLSEQSERYQTPNRKHSGGDIAANIEERILKDALAHQNKIYSNFPQQFLTMATIQTTLGWPGNREEVFKLLDPVIEQSTAVDGTTGEKGLANYSCYAAQRLAEFLGYYTRIDPTFLPEMVKRHPRLPGMWRFFIDTWCANEKYYPLSGDTMHVAGSVDYYVGVALMKDHGIGATGHMSGVLAPSMYSFLWNLYEVTKDPAFAQVLYKGNDSKIEGLPFDLFAADVAGMGREVKAIIDAKGKSIELASVNKQQWHLGILRSGKGAESRAAWLDYDAWGNHGHADGMNLGLFAKGLDLMPDLGYPPVQYGGWESERANWYKSTWAHNTVVVDGAQQQPAGGTTTLWAAGDGFSAISASAPGLNPGVTKTFERTVAMVDLSPEDSYVFDVFRVVGGKDHQKFFMSHFGTIEPSADLKMDAATDFSHPQMRNWKVARNAGSGWSVNWKIEDRYKLLPTGASVGLRYTDFTKDADAYTGEAWAVAGEYNSLGEAWLPRVMVRHRMPSSGAVVGAGPSPLATMFVSLIEPFDGKTGPLVKKSRRLEVKGAGDSACAVEVEHAAGKDVLISSESGIAMQEDLHLATDGRLALVRFDPAGAVRTLCLCKAGEFTAGAFKVSLKGKPEFVQLVVKGEGVVEVIRGKAEDVQAVQIDGKAARVTQR
jgi:hypothetical protein